jgi:uncharacterized protein YecE (DUF72 family)
MDRKTRRPHDPVKLVAPMTRCAGSGVIFFNNHVRAQAPKNARRLISQLIERGLL